MFTQGVTVTAVDARCGDCGGVVTRDLGQFIDDGRLWWADDSTCASCSSAWCEQDTGGPTPAYIRLALLDRHGPARLRLADTVPSLTPVLRVLREVLQLPLGQARAMADELRDAGLVGTLVEMELIAAGLRGRAIATTIDGPHTRTG
ncbi:hypothetical protein AB0I66_26340 [Streptomyces sp. NPDC050439]|uniref:hypothetical protein n=1 Tax=unclassified Streptomyces TaxID=2593676 RepID=UPI0034216A5C